MEKIEKWISRFVSLPLYCHYGITTRIPTWLLLQFLLFQVAWSFYVFLWPNYHWKFCLLSPCAPRGSFSLLLFFFLYCLMIDCLPHLPVIGLKVQTIQKIVLTLQTNWTWFSLIRTKTAPFGWTKFYSFGPHCGPRCHLHLLFWFGQNWKVQGYGPNKVSVKPPLKVNINFIPVAEKLEAG